tara:strand:+ start:1377 stop:1883 length:507 start_codon:yes stop_codon:yes gene_type:complete
MFNFMKLWKTEEENNALEVTPTVTLTSTEISKKYNINTGVVTKARQSQRLKPVGTFPHPIQRNVTAYLYDPKDVENWRASVKSQKKKKNKVNNSLYPVGSGYNTYRTEEINQLIGKHIRFGRWSYFEDCIKIHAARQIENNEISCTLRSAMRTNALYCLRVIDAENKE